MVTVRLVNNQYPTPFSRHQSKWGNTVLLDSIHQIPCAAGLSWKSHNIIQTWQSLVIPDCCIIVINQEACNAINIPLLSYFFHGSTESLSMNFPSIILLLFNFMVQQQCRLSQFDLDLNSIHQAQDRENETQFNRTFSPWTWGMTTISINKSMQSTGLLAQVGKNYRQGLPWEVKVHADGAVLELLNLNLFYS